MGECSHGSWSAEGGVPHQHRPQCFQHGPPPELSLPPWDEEHTKPQTSFRFLAHVVVGWPRMTMWAAVVHCRNVILVFRCWWEGQASVAAIRIKVGPVADVAPVIGP